MTQNFENINFRPQIDSKKCQIGVFSILGNCLFDFVLR